MANRKFKIGIVQMNPKPLDPDHNFSVAEAHIRDAAAQGASLIILPEYHLSGWEPKDPAFAEIARTAIKYQKAYQLLAAEVKINICAGTIVQTPPDDLLVDSSNGNTSTGAKPLTSSDISAEPDTLNGNDEAVESDEPTLLNISAFISDTGELLGTYIKTNIWIPERPHLTSSVDYFHSRADTLQSQSQSSDPAPTQLPTHNVWRPQNVDGGSQTQSTDSAPTHLPTHNVWRPHDAPDGSQSQNQTSDPVPTQLPTHNVWRPHNPTGGKAGVAHDEPYEPALSQPHEIIETKLGKIGILVCWDLAFPEAFRSLIHQGADLILIPTFWAAGDMSPEGLALNPDAEKLFLESTLVSRAFENTCTVVFCNVGGPREEGFLGLSGVYAPIVGRVKGSFDGPDLGLRIVDIDLSIQDVAEKNYKIREDLKGKSWHYGNY